MDSLDHRHLEPIQYFYHMTSTPNIRKIFQDGVMIPRKTESPYWTKLARDQNSPIGVWFSASLYQSEHPVTSSYGENRIKIPCQFIVQNMFKPRLFLESFYYFESTPKNQIVRFVLVDAEVNRKDHDWCDKNCLQRINMVDNKLLILDRESKTYKSVKNDGIMFPYIWMEVLVVGHVETVAIDTIDETSPSRQEAIPGKVPPLK